MESEQWWISGGTEGQRCPQWAGGEIQGPCVWGQGWFSPPGMESVSWPLSGEKGMRRSEWPSASAVSWSSFSLKYSTWQVAILWDSISCNPSAPLFDQMIKRPDDFSFSGHTLLNYQDKNHGGYRLYIHKFSFPTRSRPTLLSNSCQAHS